MPENAYFREPPTQTMLLDILFVYCKLNKDIGYRQGMHEVLAPILWVVSRDAVDPQSMEKSNVSLEDLSLSCLDYNYVEHDAFTLFGTVMRTVKTFYEMGQAHEPTTSGLLNSSPIVERSKRIHEHYLQQTDPELAEHLAAVEILPQIFLIRWLRLIFGREFAFDDVLALWDVIFAEDPGLDLIDLISVSMLLRIRWQRTCTRHQSICSHRNANNTSVLDADYTEALTILLKYPVPPPPHNAPSFVSDALYLRDHLSLDGGDHIISKYSARVPETTVTRKLPKKIKRARAADQVATQKASAASRRTATSPSKAAKEPRDISGIIQDAAKGVYLQGEKWGVAKALRGAVQGIQATNSTPRRASERSHWSLDNGSLISDRSPAELVATIEALEQRNKALAKLLESAVGDLQTQQKNAKEKTESDGAVIEDLSLAAARIQFVQVHLENSNMTLPSDQVSDLGKPNARSQVRSSRPRHRHQSSGTLDGMVESSLDTTALIEPDTTHAAPQTPNPRPLPSAPNTRRSDSDTDPLKVAASSSLRPRPAISQSPYSWMLGEEQRKSDFVAASPFNSRPRDSQRRGSLFGDEEKEKEKGEAVARNRNHRPIDSQDKARSANREVGDDTDDVFTTGALRAR